MKNILLILIAFVSLMASDSKVEAAPDFTLKTLKGKNYTLSKNLSGLKVVNFWATWCVPCLGEMEALKKLHTEYDGKGVEFIAISVDDNKSSAKVPSYVRSRKLPFTILLDPQKSFYKKMHVANVPSVFVINEKQEIVYSHSGYTKGDEVALKAAIDKASKE